MAHIIGDIAVMPGMAQRMQTLSCMGKENLNSCSKDVYDSEIIRAGIERAAKIKQKLMEDSFEREKLIEKCANYRKQFLN